MTVLFWLLLGLIFYTLFGYGLLIAALARVFGRGTVSGQGRSLDVVLLVAAHNEERHIRQKIENSLSLDAGPHRLRMMIACDGCTDRTVEIARSFAGPRVELIESSDHVGKIGVMNLAMERIACDVVVFSDANSRIQGQSLITMLGHFDDPAVGGVCGAIGVPPEGRGWLGWGEAIYWRFDHAMKRWESQLGGAVSAQGSLYAIRRSLLSPVPDAVADDLYISLSAVAQGYRLVFEPDARALEDVSSSEKAEFGRRVRSTEQGWRGLMLMRKLFNPARYGFYSLQLFSHKVLRRLVPFLALALFMVSIAMADEGGFYSGFAAMVVLSVSLIALSLLLRRWLPGWAVLPAFFVFTNAAMMIGMLNAFRGKRSSRWKPVRAD